MDSDGEVVDLSEGAGAGVTTVARAGEMDIEGDGAAAADSAVPDILTQAQAAQPPQAAHN